MKSPSTRTVVLLIAAMKATAFVPTLSFERKSFDLSMLPPTVQLNTAEPITRTTNNKDSADALLSTSIHSIPSIISTHAKEWLLPQPAFAADIAPPSNDEVQTLRSAFAAFYGANRDAQAAEPLLTQSIQAWERQAPDEKAGLYRVRGDCYMVLMKPLVAIQDYTTAINLLQGPGGDKADPSELPSAV